jgi:hypothetical protein
VAKIFFRRRIAAVKAFEAMDMSREGLLKRLGGSDAQEERANPLIFPKVFRDMEAKIQ